MTSGMRRWVSSSWLWIFSCLVAAPDSGRAEELPPPLPAENKLDLKHPLIYSTSLMAIGLPLMMAAGAYDSGPSLNNFESAFTSAPRWDHDAFAVDYLLHPLWGSETYLRAREGNLGIPGSIAFSMGMSVTWEYLIESWVERPSTQDLIFTTGIGWTIGELRYRLKQRSSERMDWVLDPIHKTLEHFNIVVARDRKGELAPMFTFSTKF